jgi:hypothetical protein
MTTIEDTDAWCDLIEAALAGDDDVSWTQAAAGSGRFAPPDDPDEALRQAERLAGLLDRVRLRHGETHAELDDVSEERRQLLNHARAVRIYASAEGASGPSPGTLDRLLRMMWVG